MTDETNPQPPSTTEVSSDSAEASFGEMLAAFEHSHPHKSESSGDQLVGTVISTDAESVYLDIGFKAEGILPRTAFPDNAEEITAGERLPVSVKGRNPEGYYELSRLQIAQPKDWQGLEEAFAHKSTVVGTVMERIKGGLAVDLGVRAFLPASRSGTRDAAEMEALIGQEITCRITKLDIADEDVVVDRRAVLEEQAQVLAQERLTTFKEGDVISGSVRSLAPYGAFVDLGGVDGLLHVSDMAWSRVNAPGDMLTVGQQLQLKVLKIDSGNHRISLGLKQLMPEPWDSAAAKYKAGERVTGTVTRLTDFGAFVELEPGVEGLIHVSEMSWIRKVRKPSDILKLGDTVDTMILSVQAGERRISLGLKQALGDPWKEVPQKFPVGSAIEGPVTRLMKFGAFVQLTEGVEGLVHVSEISAEKHIRHPQDALQVGQRVRAQVLTIDMEKRQIKLSMKHLVPTGLDEYLQENREGDVVSGRVVEQNAASAIIELGEGIRASCRPVVAQAAIGTTTDAAVSLSALTTMLQARWKSGAAPSTRQPEPLGLGQIRSFRISRLERDKKVIEVELA